MSKWHFSSISPRAWFIKMFSNIGLLVIDLPDNWNWSRNIVITRVSGISAEGNSDSYENSFIFIQYILGNSTASVLDDLSKIIVAFNVFFFKSSYPGPINMNDTGQDLIQNFCSWLFFGCLYQTQALTYQINLFLKSLSLCLTPINL